VTVKLEHVAGKASQPLASELKGTEIENVMIITEEAQVGEFILAGGNDHTIVQMWVRNDRCSVKKNVNRTNFFHI
jgi:hypothetical protein